jgi:hypothetical protein
LADGVAAVIASAAEAAAKCNTCLNNARVAFGGKANGGCSQQSIVNPGLIRINLSYHTM